MKPLDGQLLLKRIVQVTLQFHLFIYVFIFCSRNGQKRLFYSDGTWKTLKVLLRSGEWSGLGGTGTEVCQGEVS